MFWDSDGRPVSWAAVQEFAGRDFPPTFAEMQARVRYIIRPAPRTEMQVQYLGQFASRVAAAEAANLRQIATGATKFVAKVAGAYVLLVGGGYALWRASGPVVSVSTTIITRVGGAAWELALAHPVTAGVVVVGGYIIYRLVKR